MSKAITGIGPQQFRSPWLAFGDPDATQPARCPALGLLLMFLAAFFFGVPAADADDSTLAALEVAYGREMNAWADRLAYAVEADRENHCEAAGLFRASATAESIHAARIAEAIERMGGRAEWTLTSVVVRGTAENLQSCLARELDERDRVYARFASIAREECLYDASEVLHDVRTAGGTEVALFEAALEHLGHEESAPVIATASARSIDIVPVENCTATYTLCPGDGSLFAGPIARRCPNCGTRGSCAITLGTPSGGSLGMTRGSTWVMAPMR